MIVSATILLLILIPIFCSMVLSLPIVQNKIVDYATDFASDYLQSEVRIGRIDITMSGRIEIKDFLVKDLDADTLLFVNHTESRLLGYNFMKSQLLLGNSVVRQGKLHIRETDRADMNIREIIMRISANPGNGQTSVNIASATLSQMKLQIEQIKHAEPIYGIDIRNIELSDISGEAENINIEGSMFYTKILSLEATEKSGFQLQNICGELYVTQGALSISNANITTQWSSLTMPYLMLTGRRWMEYRNFPSEVDISLSINDGYISSDDVAYFSPSMRDYGVLLYDLDLSMSGEINNMSVDIANISYGESTYLSANASLVGLPNIDQISSDISLKGLSTTSEDVITLSTSLAQQSLPQSIIRLFEGMGRVTIQGEAVADRGVQEMDITAELESNLGVVSANMKIALDDDYSVVSMDGDIAGEEIKLGYIINNNRFENISFKSNIDGNIGKNLDLSFRSEISNIGIDGYKFSALSVATNIDGGEIKGEVTLDDPNIKFVMRGKGSHVDMMDRDPDPAEIHTLPTPKYFMSLDLQHLDLKEIGINKRDTTSHFTAKILAQAEGRNIENATLHLDLIHGVYRYNSEQISTSGAEFNIASLNNIKRIDVTSDFLDMSFESSSSVASITSFLKGSMIKYLPALYNDNSFKLFDNSSDNDNSSDETKNEREKATTNISNTPSDMSTLHIVTHDLTPITHAISTGLEMGKNSEIHFSFNDQSDIFDLNIKTDFVERKALLAIGFESTISNKSDSLSFESHIDELYIGTSHIEGANIAAKAKNNDITLSSSFSNEVDSIAVDINTRLTLQHNSNGDRELFAKLLPSKVVQKSRTWSLGSRAIDIRKGRIRIDNFFAESEDQRLRVNGYASRLASDTVKMSMRNFDLSVLSSFIAKVGYRIDGRTNGEMIASSILDNTRLEAQMTLDSVSINNIAAPSMSMDVTWDSARNRARLILEDRASKDTLVRGYYIPSQVKYYARCQLDSVNMGLIDPPLGGVINDTKGYARLDLTLQGQRRKAVLSGEIEVSDLESTISYTGVRYRVPKTNIEVSNNRLQISGAEVYDMSNGSGELDLDVNLQHLSNIGYSIRITPNNMMVLNTTEQDNEVFYGQVYASGLAQISGDKSGVRMNIAASSDDNSHFYMPLSNKESVTTADFITFVQPTVIDSLENSEISRRRRNFKRNQTSNNNSMVINMSLDVKPNIEMQLVIDPTVGDIIKARGEGKLNLSLEPKANRFEIYGDYTISEGSYLFTLQNIVNKRFVISPNSSIQWTGSPLEARLNIDAIYKLKASLQPLISDESSRAVPVDCIIQLTDLLTHPEVNFAIDLPSADAETQTMFNSMLNSQESISRQFFYLMLANSFIAESSTGTSDLGASAGAATGFELLTNQLSNWLSTSNYNVIIRYRPESELTSEELDVGFSKGLINNRLLVELEGNYVTDNTLSQTASNFMGEAYITWLIDHAGALRIKGFTQTIDRFDENQGLQETGIGIYYRESFNNFADLRTKVKARFKASDERLEKRKERKSRKQQRHIAQDAIADERRRSKPNTVRMIRKEDDAETDTIIES